LEPELSLNVINNELPVSIWLVSGHDVRCCYIYNHVEDECME